MQYTNRKYIIALSVSVIYVLVHFYWTLHQDKHLIKSSPIQIDSISTAGVPKEIIYTRRERTQKPPVMMRIADILKFSAEPNKDATDTLHLSAISPADLELPKKEKPVSEIVLQEPNGDSTPNDNFAIFDEVQRVMVTGANDVISFINAPLKWESSDYINLALISSGTLLLFSVDKQIHKNINNGGSPSNSDLIKLGHFYGETRTTELAALGVEAYGLIFNDRKAMKLGLEIYESYYIANSITGLLKYSIGRSRPSDGNGPYEFKTFDRGRRLCALPSGHATLAFSMSTVLASYTDDDHLKIIIYIPAFITAFSRIYENYHWASDVFLGAAIGHFVGKFITSRHNFFGNNDIQLNIDSEGRLGLRLDF